MQCRSCMDVNCAEVVEMNSTASDEGKTLYDLFNDCTQLQATSMDKLPKTLCTNCTQNLQLAYDFRQGARQADKHLRELVEIQKVETELIYNAIEQSEESEYVEESLNDPLAVAATKIISEPELLIPMLDIKEEFTEELLRESNEKVDEGLYEEHIGEGLCNKETDDAGYEEEHLLDDMEQDEEIMPLDTKTVPICEICNANLNSRNALKAHIFDQHKSDIICMKCPKVYEFPRELQLHETIVHGTEKELQCLKCKEILKRSNLPRHFQMYHVNIYRKYFPRRENCRIEEGTVVNCDDCSQEFETILELANHLRNHKFDCALCRKSFKKHASYKAHLKRIHKRSSHSLQDNFEFDTKYDWKNEQKIVARQSPTENDEDNIYECEFCNECFNRLSSLNAHKKRQHCFVEEKEQQKEEVKEKGENSDYSEDWEQPFKCYICSENFKTKLLYKHHMKKLHKENIRMDLTNHEGKIYECKICYTYFKSRGSFYLHRKNKHPEIAKQKTTRADNNSATILRAEDVNDAVENREFVECTYCHKQLPPNEMGKHEKQHIYRMREKSKRFLCAFCPQEFRAVPTLRKHEKKKHFGEKPESKDCPICQKKLDSKYLRMHIINVHTTERKFVCETCGDAFKSSILLRSHKHLHMERNFHCSVCDKKFIRSYDLNIHMRMHTGEEPYACHLCDRRFKIKGRLNYHLQRHAGVKRKCEVCGQEFNHVKQLKIHSYKHTGMPYRCPVCDYGCAQRDVFRKHLSRMHDMTLTNEEYCAMFKANTGRNPHVKSLEELQSEEQKMDLEDSN